MVKRGGPMLGEGAGTKKPVAKKPEKPKREVAKALAAAEKIEDLDARAKYYEAQIDRVDKPEKLVEPMVDALFDADIPASTIGEKLVELCRTHVKAAAFVGAVGRQLDARYQEDRAIEVLRMAIAAGSPNKYSLETLGRLLVARGEASGVPLLERAIDRDPPWVTPRISLAAWFYDKNPDRALALLADVEDGYAHDLRAMIYEARGEQRAMNLALREALEDYTDDFAGRHVLSSWHYAENRFDRAYVHAKALFELRTNMPARRLAEIDDLDDVDETIAQAYRVTGHFADLLPWLRERCAEKIPPDLAWHVFYGLTSIYPIPDHALAIRAGEAVAKRDKKKGDIDEVLCWRVRIAAINAEFGTPDALEALAADGLDNNAAAWLELAAEYVGDDKFDAAHAAVDRVLQLDPKSSGAISALFDLALAQGDLEAMHRSALALNDAEPTWHQGPEHLGRSFARRGEAGAALQHAKRGVAIAPYCHNAWAALCEAHIIADDFANAREAAARSVALDAPQPGDDISILAAALAGDSTGLERALTDRYKHLPALPFPAFVEKLRSAATAIARSPSPQS